MSIISLGEAELYALLGNTFLQFDSGSGTVSGFIGSNVTNYPPDGITTNNGFIPAAPLINGAAALQAQTDVTTAVQSAQAYAPSSSPSGTVLNTIISGGLPQRFNITGNLTMSNSLTISGLVTDLCIFNVTGNITINYDITLNGILAQNVIFIASGTITIEPTPPTIQLEGIFIADNIVAISKSTLNGRLISRTKNILYKNNNIITAP